MLPFLSAGMSSEDFVRGMLYLSLIVVGIPGNVAVIVAFLFLIYEKNMLLTADAIVLQLACANLLVVVVRCLLETLASFRLANVFGDVGCKSVIFIYRFSRALSVWLTFLLSAYQCLSISTPGSRWASVCVMVAQNLPFVFLFLWVLNTSLSVGALAFSISSNNGSSLPKSAVNTQFCYVNFPSELSKKVYGAAQVSRDVVPMVFMILTSLIILVFLYKHSQHVKGLSSGCSTSGGGCAAKQRAAKVVVALVTIYVVLYGVDNGLWVYTLTVRQTISSSLISDLRVFFLNICKNESTLSVCCQINPELLVGF
uniref:Vomeronasal type-1 receptor n=1 Tax=Kryptolebias marmoratus TaxID=37003 RepID=A0A3Q3B1Y5_KRYMA